MEHRCRGPWGYALDTGRWPDGRRRQTTRAGFPTRKDARLALEQELDRQRSGVAHTGSLTVGTYLEDWLAGKRNLRETTRRGYTTYVYGYLVPALGRLRLADLTPAHIDTLYTDLLAGRHRRTTPSVVQHLHRTLRSALNTAVKRRLLAWNPALHVEVPQHRARRPEVWTAPDLAAFLDATAHHRLQALFHLVALTGLRRGEVVGLHWRDVDLAQGHLIVTWQVTEGRDGLTVGAPKTAAAARVVALDRLTVEILARHRRQQGAEAAAWGPAWCHSGAVFTREDGFRLRPDYVTHLFQRLITEAGVPRIRLHDLRHTHASLALSAGVDIKVVSDRLGHSSTAITSDLYTHVVPTVARSAADAIAAAVAAGRQAARPDVSETLARRDARPSGRDPP